MTAQSDLLQPSTLARIPVDKSAARDLLDRLGESFDAMEAAIAAFEEPAGQWTVTIHFRDPPNQTAVRAVIALAADARTANALVFETIAPRDWVAASLAGLTQVKAGRFVIHGAHDRANLPQACIGIEIEAALAFGTGHHGSTRGCLLALERIVKRNRGRRNKLHVLDAGTGTGILAIATAKALHAKVLASDIDMQAVRTARANMRHNGVGTAVEVIHAKGLGSRRLRQSAPFDLVLANILLEPLKGLAAPMARLLARHACVVLSGLLPVQANAALAAYRGQGLVLDHRLLVEDWVTLVLRRP